jgi:cysteine synthase A
MKFIHITEGAKATVHAKFEGSISDYMNTCRATTDFIQKAEENGALKPGMEIIASAIGNTAIALAYVAASRGYNLNLTIPESMSNDRERVLSALGANLIPTSAEEGLNGAIKRAEEMASSEPHRYFLPNEYVNPVDPEIHTYATDSGTTVDTGGTIDVFVSDVGTGGAVTGISRYVKNVTSSLASLKHRQLPAHSIEN